MTTINTKEYQLIHEIIENFDFEKCHIAMTLLNWKWVQIGGARVPTIQELKDSAKQRLINAMDEIKTTEYKMGLDSPFIVSSGGLKASVFKNRYNHITFAKLEFVLTDWDAEP